MGRSKLLDQAGQCADANATALRFAESLTTSEAISARAQELEQACVKLINRRAYVIPGAGLMCILLVGAVMELVGVALRHWPDRQELVLISEAAAILFFMSWLPISVVVGQNALQEGESLERALGKLQPIAGTEMCFEADKHLDRGTPEVLAWRDHALSSREQLYAFDVEMMRCLEAYAQQTKPRGTVEEACRRAHGLAA